MSAEPVGPVEDQYALRPGETPEERDDRLRGPGYTASCHHWESLTWEQCQGIDPVPPYVPLTKDATPRAS